MVTDDLGLKSDVTGTVSVIAAPIEKPGVVNLTATEGVPFDATPLATFQSVLVYTGTALDPPWLPVTQPLLISSIPATQFKATIDWGDGTAPTSGVVTELGPLFAAGTPNSVATYSVSGSHVYQREGTFPIHVTIDDGGPAPTVVSGTATVAGPPLALNGALSPSSDTGPSSNDGITDDNAPVFTGTATPGAQVLVSAWRWDGSAPVVIASTTADASGQWSAAAATMADGTYTITAAATAPDGRAIASVFLTPTPLIIDTTGPKVGAVSFDARAGKLEVDFEGGLAGLDLTTVTSAEDYKLRSAQGRLIGLTVTSATAPGVVQLQLGEHLPLGRYTFRVVASGVRDKAGNALDGNLHGKFPSGNNRPGSDFTAVIATNGVRLTRVRPLPSIAHLVGLRKLAFSPVTQ